MESDMGRILVVDDEKGMREFLSIMLKKEGHTAVTAKDGQEAIDMLLKDVFDLVITDVKMPNKGGVEVLKAVKESNPDTVVIMMTAYATAETAVEAMKEGAYDYIMKPFKVDEIKVIVSNALEKRRLKEENVLLRREVEAGRGFGNIIGKSAPMRAVFDMISRVADKESTILVSGESGTGKELVARAIHSNGRRSEKPFVYIHCGALPEQLLESELFGHVKGSFTGAVDNKKGLFEVAEGGTVFLDEISETTQALQVKLLHVLQDKEFKRVGGTSDIKVDVRIISATNRDLYSEVRKGDFREDLYYRLNVIPITIPPLRQRREDIPQLADHFLRKYGRDGMPGRLSSEAMRALMEYGWPGNVRELENAIERACALCDETVVKTDHLPPDIRSPYGAGVEITADSIPEEGLDLELLLEGMEKDYLIKALEKTGGAKMEAARILGLSFPSLRHRLKKYGVD
jgi:two-component system response regulator PilR (NtrC family)